MSFKRNALVVYVKVYSLPLVKVETDLTIAILMGRQEEKTGGGILVLVFLGQEVKQKG